MGTPGGPGGPGGVATGGQADGVDVTTWEYWWLYNKDAYIDLKTHIEALSPRSGSNAAADAALEWDRVGERVMPELLTALERADDYDPTLSAMIALTRLCDGSVRSHAGELANACARRENDSNRAVAEGAIMALGILGHDPTAIGLCAILRDTPDARRKLGNKAVPARTRAFAALALGLLGARTKSEEARRYAVLHLAEQLADDKDAQPDTQAACVIAIGLIPLTGGDDGVSATGAIHDVPPSGSLAGEIALLLRVLRDEKASMVVRAHVPRALVRLGGSTSWHERIARALLARVTEKSEKYEVVQGCVLALGALADSSASPLDKDVRAALLRQADGGDLQSRCFARIALAQISAHGEEGPGVEDTRALLQNGLAHGKSRERMWSALALGVLEHGRRGEGAAPKSSAQALCRALDDARSPEEVGAAAIGCGLAGATAATPILLGQMGKLKEPRAQGYVALALGLLGAESAREPLRAMLVEARICSEKLPQTALALAMLEDPKLMPSLLELLGKSTSQSTLIAAASALGTVGDRRVVDPLLALLSDKKSSSGTRAAVIAALGRVCDRDRLPWQHVVSEGLNYRAMTVTLSDDSRSGLLDLH